jgi:arabinofuranan 3-O-arabinosyltransferase
MSEDRLFTAPKLALIGAFAICLYAGLLAIGTRPGGWLINAAGGAARTNFLAFWSAGSLALRGEPATAYDWQAVGAIESQAAGVALSPLPWVYPPTFLLVVAPLALLPYAVAFIVWLLATLIGYLVSLWAILPRRLTLVLGLGSPLVFWNILTTQNGLLTTALLGGSLALLERSPTLAGLLLGLCTYKPQLMVLFPLALLAGERWLAVAIAAATAISLAVASYLAFGLAPWEAYLGSATTIANAEFSASLFPWASLETTYGLVRWMGGNNMLAWIVHVGVALPSAAFVCWLWRQRVPYDLKAAALSAGSLLVTPYLLMYDLAAVTIAVVFLIRSGLGTGFLRGERIGFLALGALLFYPIVDLDFVPLGPFLLLALLGYILVRARAAAATR